MRNLFLTVLLLLVLPLMSFKNSYSSRVREFINLHSDAAVQTFHDYQIPASIILAQAILESGCGTSTLAKKANNYFGIKNYRRSSIPKDVEPYFDGIYYMKDDGIRDPFVKYTESEGSFIHHTYVLRKKRYFVEDGTYKQWAYSLQKNGYATDPKYAEKLITIIERYDLYEFDI